MVCWGGFNKVVQMEARNGHFSVRLWDSGDLVEAIYRTYEQLPAEIRPSCLSSVVGCLSLRSRRTDPGLTPKARMLVSSIAKRGIKL